MRYLTGLLLLTMLWVPARPEAPSAVRYVTLHDEGGRVLSTPLPVEIGTESGMFYRWSPDGRYLVYGREGDLFLYDGQTGESRNLTRTPDRWELMPAWSPDGHSLAFTSRPLLPREGEGRWHARFGPFGGSLALIRADGTGYRVLEEVLAQHPPSWSPDGRWLAYGSEGAVRLFDLETGEVALVTAGELQGDGLQVSYLGAPAWSPRRQEIAFFFAEDDRPPSREEILDGTAPRPLQGYGLLDPATRRVRVLHQYEAPFVARPPALWSPDGQKLALPFTCALIICDPVGLLLVDREGQGAQQLVREFYQAAWAPAGRRLAYIDNDTRREVRILTFRADGSRQASVIRHDYLVEGIAWRPSKRGYP